MKISTWPPVGWHPEIQTRQKISSFFCFNLFPKKSPFFTGQVLFDLWESLEILLKFDKRRRRRWRRCRRRRRRLGTRCRITADTLRRRPEQRWKGADADEALFFSFQLVWLWLSSSGRFRTKEKSPPDIFFKPKYGLANQKGQRPFTKTDFSETFFNPHSAYISACFASGNTAKVIIIGNSAKMHLSWGTWSRTLCCW